MSYTAKVLQGMPYSIVIKKARYKTKKINEIMPMGNQTVTTTLQPYSGINTKVGFTKSVPTVTVDSGMTPEDLQYRGDFGCVAVQGDYHIGLDVPYLKGNASISPTGIVTYTDKTYLEFEPFPSLTAFKAIFKVNIPTGASAHSDILTPRSGSSAYWSLRYSDKLGVWDGSWTEGATTIERDTWYWVAVEKSGATFNYYLLKDAEYTIETVPEFASWSLEFSYATDFYSGLSLTLGQNIPYPNEYFKGQIDLNQGLVEINGSVFWSGKDTRPMKQFVKGILDKGADVPTEQKYNLFYDNVQTILSTDALKDNADWIGEATVPTHTNTEPLRKAQFTISGSLSADFWGDKFSKDSFVVGNKTIQGDPFFATPWDFLARVKTNDTLSGNQTIYMAKETGYFVGLENSYWKAGDTVGSSAEKNMTYWVRVLFGNGHTSMFVLKDPNNTYTESTLPELSTWQNVVTNEVNPFPNGTTILIGGGKADYSWKGGIDLENVTLYEGASTDEKMYWKAVE